MTATEHPKPARPKNPMESLVFDALTRRGIAFTMDPRDTHGLDFRLLDSFVHIETKQFHAGRIAEQMGRVDNVVVAQGQEAVTWLASVIAPPAPAAHADEREGRAPLERALKSLRALQEGAAVAMPAFENNKAVYDFLCAIHREAAKGQLASDDTSNEGERLAAEYRASDLHQTEIDATPQGLAQIVTMLDTWIPDALPANELGQIPFARAMAESAADTIRAYLADLKTTEA